MENKNNKSQIQKVEKIMAIIGIIIAVIALVFGILICVLKVSDYLPMTSSFVEFGADFYTYEYRATRAAAINTYILDGIAKHIQLALGFILIISGLIIALVSVKKLLIATKMPIEEANEPADDSTAQ